MGKSTTHLAYSSQVASSGLLEQPGTLLWEATDLGAETLRTAIDTARDAEQPVRLLVQGEHAQHLPWELLYHRHPNLGFVAQHPWGTITRRLCTLAARPPRILARPLRLLLFIASPEDLDPERSRLDFEGEEELLFTALDRPLARGEVDIADSLWFVWEVCALPAPTRVLLTGRYAFRELPAEMVRRCPAPDAPYGAGLRRMQRLAWPPTISAAQKRQVYGVLGGNHRAIEWAAQVLKQEQQRPEALVAALAASRHPLRRLRMWHVLCGRSHAPESPVRDVARPPHPNVGPLAADGCVLSRARQ